MLDLLSTVIVDGRCSGQIVGRTRAIRGFPARYDVRLADKLMVAVEADRLTLLEPPSAADLGRIVAAL